MKPESAPESFSHILALYSLAAPDNNTVHWLSHAQAQITIDKALRKMGQTKFVNMVNDRDQAAISLALYAGDGVVTKITPVEYASSEKLPLVLPAFRAERVDCGDAIGSFMIQNFPYLDVSSVTQQDVKDMSARLESHGMKFRDGDARPDNIGRLPDGSLAVLDGGAVQLKDGYDRELLHRQAAEWEQKIQALYPMFNGAGAEFSQSEKTDFAMAPPKSAAPTVTPKESAWGRLMTGRKIDPHSIGADDTAIKKTARMQ
jgi:hypothetical protein